MDSDSGRNTKPRLLVVEDDQMTQLLLARCFEHEGYVVETVSTGREMFASLDAKAPDLFLLDLNLPDEDGLTLARQIRARGDIPVIILTARHGMADRLAGLEIGVDDFLTKPCDPREVVLRVRNVLMRTGALRGMGASRPLRFGEWQLDVASRTLTAPDGADLQLTHGEFNVLSALAAARGRVLTRGQLIDVIARNDDPPGDRMIDVFVSRLRKKIEENPRRPVYIVTVPGFGYKFSGLSK